MFGWAMGMIVVDRQPVPVVSSRVGGAANTATTALLVQDGVEVFGRQAVLGQMVGGHVRAVIVPVGGLVLAVRRIVRGLVNGPLLTV
jgi:hypothetical protein